MSNIDVFAESRLEISKRISRRPVSLEKLLPNLREIFVMGPRRERGRIVPFPTRLRRVRGADLLLTLAYRNRQISHPRFRANIVIIGFAGDACNVI